VRFDPGLHSTDAARCDRYDTPPMESVPDEREDRFERDTQQLIATVREYLSAYGQMALDTALNTVDEDRW
jgi:hypothetical protein